MAVGHVRRSTVTRMRNGHLRTALCVAVAGMSIALLAPVDGAQGAITYTSSSLGYIGNQPYSVAIGDLDADGKPDVAIANHWDKQVGILTRNAAGTGWDGPASAGSFTNGPYAVAIGDLNADGKPDLAMTNAGNTLADSTMSVIMRNAAGTGWDAPEILGQTGFIPTDLAIGDITGDGKPDLVSADASAGTVTVIARNAAGNGWSAPVTSGAGNGTHSVAIGDLDGDGKLDVALPSANEAKVTVLTRNAAGTGWNAGVDLSVGVFPASVAIADLNGDGKPDLATADTNSNQVSVIMRNGAGTGWVAAAPVATTGSGPYGLAIGDLNGDGKPDLATSNINSNDVSVITRNAAGTGWDAAVTAGPVGADPRSLAIGDVTGDGRPDIVTVNLDDNTATQLTAVFDDGPPTTTDDVPATYRGAPIPVTLTETDDPGGSGVVATYYTVGASPATPTTSSALYDASAKPSLADGERIQYFSVDAVGNAQAVQTSAAAKVDTTAPTTGDGVDAAWHAAAVLVTLTRADAQSGVDTTYYTVGAAPATPTTSSAIYDPSAKPTLADGERIAYFTVDAVGNTEVVRQSPAAKVDTMAPVTGDDVDAAWHPASVSVTLTAADAQSGVVATHYTVGASPATPTTSSAVYDPSAKPVLGDGQRISYFSVDGVGHAEAVRTSAAARVDGHEPDTMIDGAPADPGSDPRPQSTFSTAASGATFECAVDAGPWGTCASPLRPAADLADGAHTFAVRAVSRSGIRDASPAVASFTVDTVAPAAPALLGGPPPTGTSTTADIAFSTEPDASASCRVDGGAAAPCTSPLTLTGLTLGGHAVGIRQRDAAGNESGPLTVTFEVVATPPPPAATPTAVSAVLGTAMDGDGRHPVVVRNGIVSVGCRADTGALAACGVTATSVTSLKGAPRRLPKGTLLARGSSAEGVSASRSLAATLRLTKQGRSALARRPLGITAHLTVITRTAAGRELKSRVLVRLQSANRLILPVRGHRTSLSPPIRKLLARMVRTVSAAKTVRCTADTDAHGTSASDRALTRRQAGIACAYLRSRGMKVSLSSSGNGHARPRASNRTADGRRLNRRLTITTTY